VLEEDAAVYKLVGPMLIKQDLMEAKSNVSKRLEYIGGEMCVCPPPRNPGRTPSSPRRRRSVGHSTSTHACLCICERERSPLEGGETPGRRFKSPGGDFPYVRW
jgi:hypothetical protein